MSPTTVVALGELGDEAFVWVHHHVREDAETLYGFPTRDEKVTFEALLGAHGVGPSMALAILSVHAPAALVRILADDDVAALCLVPGVGKKTAARLLVELKSRLDVPDTGVVPASPAWAGVRRVRDRGHRRARRAGGAGLLARRDPRRHGRPGRRRRRRRPPAPGPATAGVAAMTGRRRRWAGERCRVREELLDPEPGPDDDVAAEATLRPRRLAEFVGQSELKAHLEIVLEAARRRGQAPDHLLFSGPPGLGKTTLAGIVATELGAHMQTTSGPAVERAGDLAAILTQLEDGDVLFVDEIHRLPRAVEEVLYPAMEDFQLDIVLGKGPAARSIRLDLPRFTLVGATTRTGSITGPLRDRFGLIARLDYYTAADLEAIVERAAGILGVTIDRAGAPRSRGGPGARPASPTGCCGGSATTPRSAATAASTRRPRRGAWRCSASTSSVSTRSTAPSSRRCASGSAAARSGCRPWPSASASRPRRSRTSTSRSSSSRACSCAPPRPGGPAGRLGPPRPGPAPVAGPDGTTPTLFGA